MGIYNLISLVNSAPSPLPMKKQTFYSDQGKGSRRVSYKAYFLVKQFRQRREEQDRSRKKADQTFQDKFVKDSHIMAQTP